MTDWFDLKEADEEAVAAFMSRVANLQGPPLDSRVPDPAGLWCKAKLLARWEAERLAGRPLDLMQPIEIAGGLVAAGLLLYLSFLT
jgi:hypothetical protein